MRREAAEARQADGLANLIVGGAAVALEVAENGGVQFVEAGCGGTLFC